MEKFDFSNDFFLHFQEDTSIYKNARKLEKFFNQQLAKWLPKYKNADTFLDADFGLNPAKRMKGITVE